MDMKNFFKRLDPDCLPRYCVVLFIALAACCAYIYALNFSQVFLCMGYAQSLALSRPFSVYAETVTLAPSPMACGLPHVYLMSFLIRVGVNAYGAYAIILAFWVLLSFWSCIRLCRLAGLSPMLSAVLPLFFLGLPSIILHQVYSVLGIGYLLIPFYVWTATLLFRASSLKGRIGSALLFTFTVIIALFMDGYSFVSAMILIGGVYLVSFNRQNWKWHLFYDPCVVLISCAAAYILYSKFIGVKYWETYPRPVFTIFRALPSAYFLPIANGFSILGDYFSYTPAQRPDYMEDFLFCLPLLIADLILLAADGGKLYKRWQYWLMWCLALGTFWLSLGPDIILDSGEHLGTGNWFIYHYLPGLNVMRATARWGIVVHIVLAAILCVSAVRSRLKAGWMVLLLCAVFFFQYFPSPNNIRQIVNGKSIEHQIRKGLVRDLKKQLKKGDTVLFVPIRNNFGQLYFASAHKANSWSTGYDKNIRMLIRAYPQEILPLTNKIHETGQIAHLDPFPAAFQIMKILLLTDVDTVVFDYNTAYTINTTPFRNVLKKDADAIEQVLQKTGFITINHSRYFAYYRLDRTKLPAGKLDKAQLDQIDSALGRRYAFKVQKNGTITMDRLKNSAAGFYSLTQAGGLAASTVRFFLQFDPAWFSDDTDVELHFDVQTSGRPQRVDIYSHGRLLKADKVTARQSVRLSVSKDLLSKEGFLDLEFVFPDAAFLPTGDFVDSCYFHNLIVSRAVKAVALDKPVSINKLSPFLTGFFLPEVRGRWAGKSCVIRLPLPQGTSGALRFEFNGWPLFTEQIMKVSDEGGRELQVLPLPKAGTYSFVVPAGPVRDNTLVLRFEYPNACRPNNRDPRTLSFFFNWIRLSMEKGAQR